MSLRYHARSFTGEATVCWYPVTSEGLRSIPSLRVVKLSRKNRYLEVRRKYQGLLAR